MKYINNGSSQNIIKDSDINLSESFQNENLADVLTQYREDLNTLKSNVKWLAKYGGVGGNGGSGGSSNIKLKYKVDVHYINNANSEYTSTFNSKTTANKLLIKDGSTATVTIRLQQCLPNTKYAVKIMYGESTYNTSVDALSLSVSKKIKCTGNSTLTIVVYADPSDMPETSIKIYTVAKSASLKLTLGTSFITPGGIILQDQVPDNFLIGNLINYLPSDYEGSITKVLVNNVQKEFDIDEIQGQSGELIKQFKISANTIFDSYGIYEVVMEYEYNGIQEFIKNTYIYKDNPVFLYCYGTNNVIYSNEQANPSISNSNIEKIIGRIYPTQGSSNSSYNYKYTIRYEGKEAIFESKEFSKEPYRDFDIQFENPYIKSDFTEESTYKKVTITFYVYDTITYTYNYYMYISLVPEIDYFFRDSQDKLFYHAVHSSTATINEEGNNACTTFPFENGLFKKLTQQESHKITKLTTFTGLAEQASSVYGMVDDQGTLSGGYVSNYIKQSSAERPDVLLSFGLKYDALNLEEPILKITVSNELEIKLCGDRIKYGNNLEFTRWNIPQDGQYHLIQLYFKPYYSFEYQTDLPTEGAFMWCIDGVFETAPIKCAKNYSFSCNENQESTITYFVGNWDFNFISVASFNAKPNASTWKDQVNAINKNVIRYVLDFDPIIPANYYQAYYKFVHKKDYPKAFDKSIYPTLYGATSANEYGINFYKGLNKFIPFDIISLSKLSDLPIYVISPKQTQNNTTDTPINQFLYDTFMGNYGESVDLKSLEVSCTFKKAIINGTEISYENMVGESKYSFGITFQGSSTLRYSTKNFEISAQPFVDPSDPDVSYDVFWTPDESKFLPEKSFTLKADVVDSSHSNNAVIGKFVNNYMKNSAMQEGVKTCLEGFPILLFMEDTLENNEATLNHVFLGIYSFNLGRNSEINLGYKNLDKSKCEIISSETSTAKAYLVKDSSAVVHSNKYKVAEVQGGSPLLYDYSQYDQLLLKDMMLGDFFLWDGQKESNQYTHCFQRPFKGLNKLIYQKFIVDLNENYTSDDFDDNDVLVGYYKPIKGAGIFNVLKLNFNYSKKYEVDNQMYYVNSTNNTLDNVPNNGLVLDKKQIDTIQPYLTKGSNDLTVIGNPFYQFHVICNSDGAIRTPNLFYVEMLTNITSFDGNNDDYFNYDNTLRYYMVCMLFAMVDSVQKNLTIRCRNFEENRGNEWLLGFYDMDTAFGVDNIGNPVDYKAFSDFIAGDGKVIYDYYHEDSENKEGSGFDVPSHYLFLLAKYINILASETETTLPLGERTYTENSAAILKTPFNYWQSLRRNELKDLNKFFENYIDSHFGELNPIIWNLDYLYKYFSKSNNTSTTDTEQSKFNGTRRYSRKTWFQERVKILDVLFGIRNNHKIGNSDTAFIGAKTYNNKNPEFLEDVPISKTMFPSFTKGMTTSGIDVTIKTKPKTPVVMQTESAHQDLYIADKNGDIKNITATISQNTDIGFYGTTEVFQIDECGQFLIDTNNNKSNSIKNDYIKEIIINKCPTTGGQKIDLKLEELKSVSSILVNKDITKEYKGVSFTISNQQENRIINEITFDNCIFSSNLVIMCDEKLTINKLVIKQCSGTELKLHNVNVLSLELSSNQFETYDFEGEFPEDITITDNTAKTCTFKLLNNENKITLKASNLADLTLNGSISSFVNVNENPCTTININEISPVDVTMDLKNFINYAGPLTINLINAEELTLSCANNQTLGKINIQAKKLKTVNLLKEAFYKNFNLNEININNSNWLNKTIYVKGSYAFARCGNLPISYIIPQTNSKMYLSGTDMSYMYANTQVSTDDVIQFFTNVKSTVDTINLTKAFVSCPNLNFKLNVDNTTGICTYPLKYTEFKNALSDFKNGKTVNLNYSFISTPFNFLDKDLVNLFKYNKQLTEVMCDGDVLYVSSDFLNGVNSENNIINGDVETLSLSSWVDTLTGHVAYTSVKFYKFDSESSKYKIITNVELKNILNNGKLKTINSLNPYTDDQIQVICTNNEGTPQGGFPNTVTKINSFLSNVTTTINNHNDFENIFYDLDNCEVNIYNFARTSSIKTKPEQAVNIYNLLFKQDNDGSTIPKVKFKLSEKSTYSARNNAYVARQDANAFNLRFYKTCTQDEFKKIMEYFLRIQKNVLNGTNTEDCDLYNQLPGLFADCTITGVESFKELITAEDGHSFFTRRYKENKDGTFDYSTGINYIDLFRTFNRCVLKDPGYTDIPFNCSDLWECVKYTVNEKEYFAKTPVISLSKTFMETNQKKIMEPFHIKDVKTMSYCFFNCQYTNSFNDDDVVISQPAEGLNFAADWKWVDNFPLIPQDFFTGFNVCDITQCFASDKITSRNLQGQLFTEGGWWSNDDDVDVSTIPNFTQNALLHPVVRYETVEYEGVEETVLDYYCLYPQAYTNKFKSDKGVYNHVTLPLCGDYSNDNANTLYIFEDYNTDLFLGKLPKLPPYGFPCDYWTQFFSATTKCVVKINKNNCFNNSTLMSNSDYKEILPNSLFLVLNSVNFKNRTNISKWGSPIIIKDYVRNQNGLYFENNEITPGGIVPSNINSTLLSKLKPQ